MNKEMIELMNQHESEGDALFNSGEFEKAASAYFKAHHLSHALFMETDDEQYLEKTISLFEKTGDCYSKMNSDDASEKSEYEFFKALVFSDWAIHARDIVLDETIARISYKLGVIDYNEEQYEKATESLLKAFEIYKKLIVDDFKGFHVRYSNTAEMLSRVYFAIGDDIVATTYKTIAIDTLKTYMGLVKDNHD